MTYDIIDQCSIRPAAALGSLRCGSGLAATLPRLCRPEPALADTLAPYPLSLRDRHHAGAAPAVAPHPDVHLVEPAAVAPVPLRVGGGVSKTLIVLEAVWDRGVTVASDVARNERGAHKHVCRRAKVETGQARVAGRVIEHGHSRSLHDTVRRQLNGLKRAEIHQGYLLVCSSVPLGACRTQGAVEEELRARIPHQAVPLQVKIGLDVERFHRVRIVGVGRQYHHAVLFTTSNHI
jgi:hypothetical protein